MLTDNSTGQQETAGRWILDVAVVVAVASAVFQFLDASGEPGFRFVILAVIMLATRWGSRGVRSLPAARDLGVGAALVPPDPPGRRGDPRAHPGEPGRDGVLLPGEPSGASRRPGVEPAAAVLDAGAVGHAHRDERGRALGVLRMGRRAVLPGRDAGRLHRHRGGPRRRRRGLADRGVPRARVGAQARAVVALPGASGTALTPGHSDVRNVNHTVLPFTSGSGSTPQRAASASRIISPRPRTSSSVAGLTCGC